jgi:hypothetical protein
MVLDALPFIRYYSSIHLRRADHRVHKGAPWYIYRMSG